MTSTRTRHRRVDLARPRRAVVAVPLLVQGARAIGVLQVGTVEKREFSENDAQLLQLAADRLAVAIDRARLNEQAHHIAATLQRSLLPSSVPQVPGIELATRYQPGADGAQVGGDLYDVVPYSDGRGASRSATWWARHRGGLADGPRSATRCARTRWRTTAPSRWSSASTCSCITGSRTASPLLPISCSTRRPAT